jgi:hypothetical protein
MLTVAAVVVLLVVALSALQSIVGTLLVATLGDDPPGDGAAPPTVSVIVAARNESAHVRRALASVLAQDHPRLDVVFVNDRSEDDTGRIADEMASMDPRLRVIHVAQLPAGWLGKNHALHLGASEARGEWLLFTDADVWLHPRAVRAGVEAAARRRLDMLACSPRVSSPSAAVRTFVAGFAIFFGLYARIWEVRSPRWKTSVGIGAFNLVRASSYRAAGGHTRLRLRPDDDVMLGRVVKAGGGRCDLMFASGLVSVDWYSSLSDLVAGLMKNAFAGLGYRVGAVFASVAGILALGVAPLVLAATLSGPLQAAAIGICGLLAVAALLATRGAGLPMLYGLGLPFSSLLFSYIVVRATALTLWQGGIYWRGTFYPLDELRRNRRV